MNKKLFLAISLVLAMIAGNAMAQTSPAATPLPVKIGYCNPEYIISNMPEAAQIEKELEVFQKQLYTQLNAKIENYKVKLNEYKAIANDPSVPNSIKADKEAELRQLEESIQLYEENAQTDFENKKVQLLTPVYDKVQKSIDRVADANGYTYIFNTHSDMSGSTIILYARYKTDDISNLVLKDMGVTPPPANGTAPAPANNNAPGHSGTASPGTQKPMAPTR